MRKVIHKLFWVWDYEEEEKWLNEMAAKGLSLISVKLFTYEFENTLPGEYHVCLQVLEHTLRHPETEEYIRFLEETGVEHVGTCVREVYFRKKTEDGPFELFSDRASLIRQLNHIITLLAILIWPNFFNACNCIISYIKYPNPTFLFGTALAAFMVGLLITGIIKLSIKKKKLDNEQQIFE